MLFIGNNNLSWFADTCLMQTPTPTTASAGKVNNTPGGKGRKKSSVVCRTSQGTELSASLLRMTRFTAAFEVHPPDTLLRASEVFEVFQIVSPEQTLYSGSAVIRSLVDFGSIMVCEAELDEGAWQDAVPAAPVRMLARDGFHQFLREWEGFYKILPEFKVAVADLQSFLDGLRRWLESVETGTRALPAPARAAAERETLQELMATATPAISAMFERFEFVAASVPEELIPAHRAFCRRQLLPLLLCCPFMNRIFTKPLGYAGDYEMMNMIVRNAPEGDSLFAKLLQTYILSQAPAVAVRNRVDYFVQKFVTETARASAAGCPANLCSIGCGPAREVESFMAREALSNQARFRLLDFNDETLRLTGERLDTAKTKHHRQTRIELVKKPAQFLLKESGKVALGEEKLDVIYCSGLYDYLSDRVIQALNTRLYERLRPGGVLIVTNFDPYNPIRHIMEFIFDWFLIHRDGKRLAALAPAQARQEHCEVRAEMSGCNIFLETRKPA